MKLSQTSAVCVALGALGTYAFDYAHPPVPMHDPVACGASHGDNPDGSIVCDPDGLMTGGDRLAAIEAARALWQDIQNECSEADRKPQESSGWSFGSMFGSQNPTPDARTVGSTPGHEMALYVMNELPRGYSAEALARKVHDSWGLGSPKCGNGVLIVMSRLDREAYWSTGDAAGRVMFQSRIDAALQ